MIYVFDTSSLVDLKHFQIERFQQLISTQAMLKGKPVADPFVIAAAAIKHGTVVTQERP